ncbi:hypothetical protein D3C87_1958670 [compost metagenome]
MDLQDEIAPERLVALDHLRAGGTVGVVREARAFAGACLHEHAVFRGHELGHRFGRCGDPRLAGLRFRRNADVHTSYLIRKKGLSLRDSPSNVR